MVGRGGWSGWAVVLALALLPACGGDGAPSHDGAGGGSAGLAGSAGSAGTVGGSTAGSAGSAAGGAAAVGGSGSGVDCTGTFAAAELAFNEAQTVIASLSLPADELELFYVQSDAATQAGRVVKRSRSDRSAAWGEATSVPELDDVCGDLTPGWSDVSNDGLRLYLACDPLADGAPAPLYRAERASRAAPFADVEPLGMTEASMGLSSDELTLLSSRWSPETVESTLFEQKRNNHAEPFGPGQPLGGTVAGLRTPELSSDGAVLFGHRSRETGGAELVAATRPSLGAPFGELMTLGLPSPPASPLNVADGSPAISADCKTLYFIRVTSSEWTVHVARR